MPVNYQDHATCLLPDYVFIRPIPFFGYNDYISIFVSQLVCFDVSPSVIGTAKLAL